VPLETVELAAADLHAVVVPELGARVISLTHRGAALLWRNPDLVDDEFAARVPRADPRTLDGFATWQNWGGDKSWVAPQGWADDDVWHGPPDPTFDGGAFEVTSRSASAITMRSNLDPVTGVRMTRSVTVTEHGMHVTTVLRNESSSPRRWAAWEVAQLPVHETDLGSPYAGIFVGVRAGSEPVHLMRLRGGLTTSTASNVTRVPFQRAVGKLGFPGSTGVMELRHAEGVGLRLAFRTHPYERYPDDSAAQLWMQTPLDEPLDELGGLASTAALVELEAMSPLRRLEPGASVALSCDWTPIPPRPSETTPTREGGD
jgi:hypothetical protein